MKVRGFTGVAALNACALALTLAVHAAPQHRQDTKLNGPERIAILQALVAKVGIARRPIPADKHGIKIAPDGRVLNADEVAESLNDKGNSARVGDRLAITAIEFKDDQVVFSINGGPHKSHWYDHISIGMGSGTTKSGNTDPSGPHGAVITLQFHGDVPSLSVDEVKKDLGTLIDWEPPSKAEEMVKALPVAVKTAINAHHVLVGMDEGMVVAALGRTGNKVRESNDEGQRYEDWIYGAPPEATTFVRFMGGRVVRVTRFDHGVQTVDVTPEPSLATAATQQKERAAERAAAAAEPAPSLRRPGDPVPTLKPGGPPPRPIGSRPDGAPPGGAPGQSGVPPGGPPGGPPTTTRPPVCCWGRAAV